MNFGAFFVNVGPFSDPRLFSHLATSAEQHGVESLWTVEHVVIPVGYEATYPYDESGKIPMPNNTPLPDPLLPLAYAAAITTKIKLATGILILPQRHPFYVAKEAATLDQLSGGRFILGIGVGWMHDEFEALGIPFAERGPRTDESIRALRSLWKGEPEAFECEYFRWNAVEMNPKPVQKNGVPIVIGGHSKASARRAARLGDGFFPGVGTPQEVTALKQVMAEECAKIGRDPNEIEITAVMGADDPALVEGMAAAGVSRLLAAYDMGSGKFAPGDIDAWLDGLASRHIGA
ncbi:MAG: LLM class F420-dependent oxidoreductase [Gammaproteobacteria bacterium]|nr:LLM class F420-dependent oxidoreductase [Gammaproteobacteria bacterium]MCP5199672.1 LLM class F420-dependent oxidoreductase [Gammaproteobacteria bacterium]